MTHDDDIPELLKRLEGRLGSPSPEGIRAEASRRRASRRRALSTAGVFALVLAIAGGSLWFTRDTATETATVADDVPDLVDVRPVADDSPPVSVDAVSLLRSLVSLPLATDFTQDANPPFLPRNESAFVSFLLPETDSTASVEKSAIWFSNGCQADMYQIDWVVDGFTIGDQVGLAPNQGLVAGTLCEQPVLKSRITPGQFVSVAYDPETTVFALGSDGYIRDSIGLSIISDTDSSWTLSLVALKPLSTTQ